MRMDSALYPVGNLDALVGFRLLQEEGDEEQVPRRTDQIAARVGDWSITREYLDDYLRRLPDPQRQKYDTPEGRAILAETLMQEELSYLEAKKLNLAAREPVKKQIERRRAVFSWCPVHRGSRGREGAAHRRGDARVLRQPTRTSTRSSSAARAARLLEGQGQARGDQVARRRRRREVHHAGADVLRRSHHQGRRAAISVTSTRAATSTVSAFRRSSVTRWAMEPGKVYGPIQWEEGYSLVRINEKVPASCSRTTTFATTSPSACRPTSSTPCATPTSPRWRRTTRRRTCCRRNSTRASAARRSCSILRRTAPIRTRASRPSSRSSTSTPTTRWRPRPCS